MAVGQTAWLAGGQAEMTALAASRGGARARRTLAPRAASDDGERGPVGRNQGAGAGWSWLELAGAGSSDVASGAGWLYGYGALLQASSCGRGGHSIQWRHGLSVDSTAMNFGFGRDLNARMGDAVSAGVASVESP